MKGIAVAQTSWQRLALSAGLAASVMLTGCTSTLDTGKIEKKIKSQIEKNHPNVTVTVKCPDSVKVKKGGTFKCHVKASGGQEADATVTQLNDKGDVRFVVP
jgi:ethanolamine utilization protein EutQ (cupin superfamily)